MASRVAIASADLSAEIAPLGAELQRLTTADGRELLWNGDAAWWSGRAPILFPIVGGLAGDRYSLSGKHYPLPRHGFARRRDFALVAQGAGHARFRLEDDAETRAVYPFAFALELDYRLSGPELAVTATIINRDAIPLPASIGFHPAFRWPIGDAVREDGRILFSHAEPHPVRRLDAAGLLRPEPEATPVEGDTLTLRDDLFTRDALILDRLEGQSLRYGPLEIAYPDARWLGIWSKPGAPFICIEPWQGVADPAGYEGDFRDKPGVIEIAPGASYPFRMSITLRT